MMHIDMNESIVSYNQQKSFANMNCGIYFYVLAHVTCMHAHTVIMLSLVEYIIS